MLCTWTPFLNIYVDKTISIGYKSPERMMFKCQMRETECHEKRISHYVHYCRRLGRNEVERERRIRSGSKTKTPTLGNGEFTPIRDNQVRLKNGLRRLRTTTEWRKKPKLGSCSKNVLKLGQHQQKSHLMPVPPCLTEHQHPRSKYRSTKRQTGG